MEQFVFKGQAYEVENLEPQTCFNAVYTEGDEEKVYYQVCKALGIQLTLWSSRAQQIQTLKEKLTATDYIALKAFEGQDVSGYPDWKVKRQEIRSEINRLELITDAQWDAENDEKYSE